MKTITAFIFLIFVEAQVLHAQEKEILLTFEPKGILLSSPPEILLKDNIKKFEINIEKDTILINRKVETAWNMYYQLARKLLDTDELLFRIYNGVPKKNIPLSDFSINDGKDLSVYWVIILQTYAQMEALKNEFKNVIYGERETLFLALDNDIDTKMTKEEVDREYKNKLSKATLVPNYKTLINTEYTITLRGYNRGNYSIGQSLNEKIANDQYKIEMTNQLKTLSNEKEETHYIDYELTTNNSIYNAVSNQFKKYSPPASKFITLKQKDKLLQEYEDFLHNKENQNFYDKAIKLLEELREKDDNEKKSILQEESNRQLTTDIGKQYSKIIEKRNALEKELGFELNDLYADNFFYAFLWFNNGRLSANPFIYSTQKIIDRRKELKDTVDNYQSKKEALQQRILFYENISRSNESLSKEQLEIRSKTYDSLLEAKLKLDGKLKDFQEELKQNEQQLTNLKQQNLSFQENTFQDKLLYRGRFYLSSSQYIINRKIPFTKINIRLKLPGFEYGYVMRHHNASDNYDVMTANYKAEIREDQRMMVLVHNEQQDSNILLKPSYTPLEDKLDYLGLALGIKEADNLEEVIDFATAYNQLNPLQYGYAGHLPALIKDDTANYVTKLAAHQAPLKSPLEVKYDIERNKTKVKEGEYRINRLYRFRFKTGAIFSWLERKNYNTVENSVTIDTERHGLDATFGIQYFLIKQDIRSPEIGFRPFLYTGFSLSKSPIKNWYVGGGIELVNGLAILGGLHLGEGEKLTVDNNQITVGDKLVYGRFISLAFDLNVFNRIFNFGEISNPFRINE